MSPKADIKISLLWQSFNDSLIDNLTCLLKVLFFLGKMPLI